MVGYVLYSKTALYSNMYMFRSLMWINDICKVYVFLGVFRFASCSRSSCRNEVNEECSIKFTHCRLELLAFKPRKCITHKKGGSKDVSDF